MRRVAMHGWFSNFDKSSGSQRTRTLVAFGTEMLAAGAVFSKVAEIAQVAGRSMPVIVDASASRIAAGRQAAASVLHDISSTSLETTRASGNQIVSRSIVVGSGSSRAMIKQAVPYVQPKVKSVGTQQIGPAGLNHPVPLLPHEFHKIQKWTKIKDGYLKKWVEKDISGVRVEIQDLLVKTKADKTIHKHMTPDDLAAIFKEDRGVKIFKNNGELFKHKLEGDYASESLGNTATKLKDELTKLQISGKKDTLEHSLLQEKLSDLSKLKDSYADLIREAKCHNQKEIPKLRP